MSICLNMIVKNEGHIIEKTLENLCSYIKFSYWVICDTGSTDNTKEVITTFFKNKKIKGKLVDTEWKDFGYNRTIALQNAYNTSDYLLIFDADDSINGEYKTPTNLHKDMYQLRFGENINYWRPLLINNRKKWVFKGVLHEYLTSADNSPTSQENILGKYFLDSGRSGDRSKDPKKYLKDGIILENAIKTETDIGLKNRYLFYAGQSFKDCGEYDKAIEFYTQVIANQCWKQEQYYSCIMMGSMYKSKKDDCNALKYFLLSDTFDPERIEGLIMACEMLLEKGMNYFINAIYNDILKKKIVTEYKLFISTDLYNDHIEFYNSIACYYLGMHKQAYELAKQVIINRKIDFNKQLLSVSNLQFTLEFIKNDSKDTLEKLFNIVNAILKQKCKSFQMSDTEEKVWNILFEYAKPNLIKLHKYSFKNKPKPKILLSFTTCKRIELFTKTINSILNTWTDVSSIDYWFCVDDNSEEKDKNLMTRLYPWIDYYMKTPEEKGHRESMNIIWNKLNELKPDYWIHMEDDFLFFEPMDYVKKGIEALKQLESRNVKQVLFNRSYAETISGYNIISHEVINDDFCIHVFEQNKGSDKPNCFYWPHYSFRPSIIDVKTILQLGNFNSPNTFFEMDFAHRYVDKGFKSAFFNQITNIHIGRLTSERGDTTKPNAYILNNTEQFSNNNDKDKDDETKIKTPPPIKIKKSKTTSISNSHTTSSHIKMINLKRREDRKKEMIEKLNKVNIQDLDLVEAVDGLALEPTSELAELFKGNDFANRKGIIGCALTHYYLWQDLLEDTEHEYYLILEDDCTFTDDFGKKVKELDSEFKIHDLVFLGYHMHEYNRQQVKDIYESNNANNANTKWDICPLINNLYIGATFAYTINKQGAQRMCDYIDANGIKHGIDYIIKINTLIECKELRPQIAFSDWHEAGTKVIDTDIQNNRETFDFSKLVFNDHTGNKVIAFHDNSLSERGTSVAVYDYAYYNQVLLGNRSIIIYDKNDIHNNPQVIQKFEKEFDVFGYTSWSEVDEYLHKNKCSVLYLIKYGNNDGKLSKICKNVVHCVFDCRDPHGDIYSSISQWVKNNNNKYPVVPHMINLPTCNENMREQLHIPKDGIVFGRYGGFEQFDIEYVKNTIIKVAQENPTHYFVFVNTKPFSKDISNIIYLDKIIDLHEKVKFINTCDAMIWGRSDGETFGSAIAEFSTKNKPVIACKYYDKSATGVFDIAHVALLGEKALWYKDEISLHTILTSFNKEEIVKKDWNAYRQYTPKKVMAKFNEIYLTDIISVKGNTCENNMYSLTEAQMLAYNTDTEALQYLNRHSDLYLKNKTDIDKKMDKSFIINFLIKKYNYKKYLEIGCRKDTTFNQINIDYKRGVDPEQGGTHRMTSDEFFEQNVEKFDIIFIDGLHLSSQVLKDAYNSLEFLNDNGTIIFHDAKPLFEDECTINPRDSKAGYWNGDVWKAIVELKTLSDIDIRILDCDWGVGILRKKKNTQQIIIDKEYTDLTFDDYITNFWNWINPITFNDLCLWLDNYKILFFMTTHRQTIEIDYSSVFFNKFSTDLILNSDITLHCNNINISKDYLETLLNKFPQQNKHLIHTSKNTSYLLGAFEALSDNFDTFQKYDYVIHLNPDVYITNPNKLLTLLNRYIDSNKCMILSKSDKDFYANDFQIFKPKEIPNIYSEWIDKDLQNKHKCCPETMLYEIINKHKITHIFNTCNRGNRLVDENGIWHFHGNNFVKTYIEQPEFTFSEKDIMNEFVFIKGMDQINNDVKPWRKTTNLFEHMVQCLDYDDIKGVNTLGYFKSGINELTPSPYFGPNDGIYIKKEEYEKWKKQIKDKEQEDKGQEDKGQEDKGQEDKGQKEEQENFGKNNLRIKMLCNWCPSSILVKEWSNMFNNNTGWNNLEIVDNDVNIDYYIIINQPFHDNDHFIPEKTIVFQMEPWVYDSNKNWGVKTWGKWAIPDETAFMKVFTHKNHLNNVQWQIDIPTIYSENRKNQVISILSSKLFDDGHIKRVQFIKYMEEHKGGINLIDIFGKENYHTFKNYQSALKEDKKENHYIDYKYCFSVENNFETNYATEKIWEPILCECLTFYWGCPNLEEYIDSKAFVRLDLNDFEGSMKIVEQAISEDWWSQRIDIIRKEKQKILHEYGFFPLVNTILDKHRSVDTEYTIQPLEITNFNTILINLERRKDRLDYIHTIIHSPFEIFAAIDGSKLNNYMDDNKYNTLLQLIHNKECIFGEIGCKLSHYGVWTSITENTLVLEDDIKITENTNVRLKEVYKQMDELHEDWDIIYVGGQWTPNYGIHSTSHMKEHKIEDRHINTMFVKKTNHLYKRVNNNDCTGFSPIFRAAGGYIISPSGAKKIMSEIDANKDFFMNTALDIWLLVLEKQKKVIYYDFFEHPFYQGGFDLMKEECLLKTDIIRDKKEVFYYTG